MPETDTTIAAAGTDAGAHVLRLKRVFNAPRARVFRAFSERDQVAKWFGPATFICRILTFEPRPGGRYALELTSPDNTVHPLSGEFFEVSEPDRLVYSWIWGGDSTMAGQETLVTLEFHDVGDRTEVELVHSRLPSMESVTQHGQGWQSSYVGLTQLLADQSQS